MTRVEIDADGRRVSVHHDGDLGDVVTAAVTAWRDTGHPAAAEQAEPERLGSVGFSAALEIAPTHDTEVTAR